MFVFKIGDIIENKINNTFAKIYSIDDDIVVLMCYDNVFSIFSDSDYHRKTYLRKIHKNLLEEFIFKNNLFLYRESW